MPTSKSILKNYHKDFLVDKNKYLINKNANNGITEIGNS